MMMGGRGGWAAACAGAGDEGGRHGRQGAASARPDGAAAAFLGRCVVRCLAGEDPASLAQASIRTQCSSSSSM